MADQMLPHYLFGIYVLEISNFFRTRFASFKTTTTALPQSLQVFFGTPQAAFRYMIEKYNGKTVLPMMNFQCADFQRIKEMERPVLLFDRRGKRADPENPDNLIPYTRDPAKYKVTWNCVLWTNTKRERDYLMHKIALSFPMGEMSLVYIPDPVNNPKEYLLMPLVLEDQFTDETETEGLDMKEVQDVIKTQFTMTGTAIVPYNIMYAPVITYMGVKSTIEGKSEMIYEKSDL